MRIRYFLVLIAILAFSNKCLAQSFFSPKDLMSVGVYYYPEHWSEDQWERDISNIAQHGFEFIHMAEFAWAQMEPTEGNYDFSWLDEVIHLAAKYHLKVVLGTPTPCPPVWLGIKHPEIYLQDAHLQSKEHGTRANMALSSPVVLDYTQKIVRAMGKHYGQNSAVIGWQIDNEPEAKEDFSTAAQEAFRLWLEKKYGAIDNLNESWGLAFWSQLYGSFSEVNIHNAQNVGWWGVNPIALLDYKRFTADVQADFLDFQANELRKYIDSSQYITTNYMAKHSSSDPKRSENLDFASFTAYPNNGSPNLGKLGFRLGDYSVLMYANDYYKSVSGNAGVMELQPGQVNWANYNSLLQPGTVRMWLWHCFAGGSSFACTYRYRQILAGAEQYHHGIVTTDGVSLSQGGEEYVKVIREMQHLRKIYNKKASIPDGLEQRKTAILWSFDNLWNLQRQKQTYQWDTWQHMQRYQGLLHSFGAPVDFISETDDFKSYDYVVVPAYEMVDSALVKKWQGYVADGGQLIISLRTGAKDKNAHLWESNLSGIMNDLIGGKIQTFDMLPSGHSAMVTMDGNNYSWSSWGDQIIAEQGTEVLATYTDQFYKGSACVLKHAIGKGIVWYIGVESLDGSLEKEVLKKVFQQKGVALENYPEGVLVSYRDGFMVGVNYSSESYVLNYNGDYLIGDNILEPADVAVWRAE